MSYIYPKKIRSILRGESAKTQIGYEKKKDTVTRKVGDRWIDEDGNEWEQKQGYVAKVRKIEGVTVPIFCPKCNRKMGKASKDAEIYWKFGFCLNCLIDRDAEMIKKGTFDDYQKNYIKSKQLGFYQDAKAEIEEFMEQIEKGYIEYPNSDGTLERWDGDMTKLKEFWDKELEFVNKKLKELQTSN